MPKTRRTFTITMVVTNGKALAAFVEGVRIVQDVSRDQPWNSELKKAVRRLEYAVEGLKFRKRK